MPNDSPDCPPTALPSRVRAPATFTKNKITDVSFVPDDDMLAVFYPLAETAADSVCKQILENQSAENIALSDEYAVTGQLVADAAEACINRAKK